MERNKKSEPRRFYARPGDRSFEAYKSFIRYMTVSLGAIWDVTEEDLRASWRQFWAAADRLQARERSGANISKPN